LEEFLISTQELSTNTNVNETANNNANATVHGGTKIQLRVSLR